MPGEGVLDHLEDARAIQQTRREVDRDAEAGLAAALQQCGGLDGLVQHIGSQILDAAATFGVWR